MDDTIDVSKCYGWAHVRSWSAPGVSVADDLERAIGVYPVSLGSGRAPTCAYCGRQGRAGHNCDGCGAQVRS